MSARPPASIELQTKRYQVSATKLRAMVGLITERLGVGGHEVSVRLTDSRRIRTLNRDFRGIDKATDVLSFPQIEWPRPLAVKRLTKATKAARGPKKTSRAPAKAGPAEPLGDIVISLPDAQKNAASINQPLDREVCFLLVHGILHLCGHDHMQPADERRMLSAQRALMRYLTGQGQPPPIWTRSVKALRHG